MREKTALKIRDHSGSGRPHFESVTVKDKYDTLRNNSINHSMMIRNCLSDWISENILFNIRIVEKWNYFSVRRLG